MNDIVAHIEKIYESTRSVCENERLHRIRDEIVRLVRKYPASSAVTALIMGFYFGRITTRGRRS